MRVLVCGGRDYEDLHEDGRNAVFVALSDIHAVTPIAFVMQGGAKGADRSAREWAATNNVPGQTYHADWSTFGRAAGPIRNRRMLANGNPDLVVAFAGGRGTADMVRLARNADIKVIVVPSRPLSEGR